MYKLICQREACKASFMAKRKRQRYCCGSCGAKARFEEGRAGGKKKAVSNLWPLPPAGLIKIGSWYTLRGVPRKVYNSTLTTEVMRYDIYNR